MLLFACTKEIDSSKMGGIKLENTNSPINMSTTSFGAKGVSETIGDVKISSTSNHATSIGGTSVGGSVIGSDNNTGCSVSNGGESTTTNGGSTTSGGGTTLNSQPYANIVFNGKSYNYLEPNFVLTKKNACTNSGSVIFYDYEFKELSNPNSDFVITLPANIIAGVYSIVDDPCMINSGVAIAFIPNLLDDNGSDYFSDSGTIVCDGKGKFTLNVTMDNNSKLTGVVYIPTK